jgi:hypothetical protein
MNDYDYETFEDRLEDRFDADTGAYLLDGDEFDDLLFEETCPLSGEDYDF